MLIFAAVTFQLAAALIVALALSYENLKSETLKWLKYGIFTLMALASIMSIVAGVGKPTRIDPVKPVTVDTIIVHRVDTVKAKQDEVMNNTISVFRDVFGAGSAGNDEFLKKVNDGL